MFVTTISLRRLEKLYIKYTYEKINQHPPQGKQKMNASKDSKGFGKESGWGNGRGKLLLGYWLVIIISLFLWYAFSVGSDIVNLKTEIRDLQSEIRSYEEIPAPSVIVPMAMPKPPTIRQVKVWVLPLETKKIPTIILGQPENERTFLHRKKTTTTTRKEIHPINLDWLEDLVASEYSQQYESQWDNYCNLSCWFDNWGTWIGWGGHPNHWDPSPNPVIPEPSTFLLGSIGLIMLAVTNRKRIPRKK